MKPQWFLVFLVLLAAGCATATPEVVTLPTLAVLPTEAPTHTALAPTWTYTPSNTPTPTISPTPTTTLTFTPSVTYTPSRTPTHTITPTNTATPTATATSTASMTPTSESASFTLLEAEPTEISPGGQVQLRWQTDSEGVTLEIQDQQGQTVQTVSLPPYGEQTFTVPPNLQTLVVFKLSAQRGETPSARSVAVTINCGGLFFFGAGRVQDTICPSGVAESAVGRYQPFERGYMIYVPTRNINQVLVLYGTLTGGSFVLQPTNATAVTIATPSASNQFLPQNEFTGVWQLTTSPAGNTWQTEVGYGLRNAESTTVTLQNEDGNSAYYVGMSNGQVFRLVPSANQPNLGAWALIP